MKLEPKPYFSGIEKKLIDNINSAKTSIKIAMAWFTSEKIIDSLINQKRSNPKINIEIVVDENEINKNYFLKYKQVFNEVKILIKRKVDKRFLHDKFMVIDGKITITGSYNYSKKGQSNLENIVVIKSKLVCSYYSRIFNFITTTDYIDENVQLLLDYPEFAQTIISTHYNFTKNEYIKYKNKIEIGDCFTYNNGLYDQIEYIPGLIFNPKIAYNKNISSFEFELPINKRIIKSWVNSRNQYLILNSYQGNESEYHLINGDLKRNTKTVENFFKQKMEHTYKLTKLKSLIENGVDIIIEDDLWLNNFEPFLTKKLIERIFDNIEMIEKTKW
jgi:hypothetical protein